MKHIKKYQDYITEKKAPKEEVYSKYYSDIPNDVYDKIIAADPTARNGSIGLYSKWLLSIYRDKKLKLEDLYKATEYLTAFNKFKHKLRMKDLSKVSSLQDLLKLVEPFLEKEESVFANDYERQLIGQFKQVFKGKNYRIIIPLTLKASKYFGRGTEWCTLNTDQFEHYTMHQNPQGNVIDANCLYIMYTEKLDQRVQFSFESRQFMDVDDRQIDLNEFFEVNKDIKDFFNSHFKIRIYTEPPDMTISELSHEYGLRMDMIELYGADYDSFEDYQTKNPNWLKDYDIVFENFEYDDNPMDGSITFQSNFITSNKESVEKLTNMLKDIYKDSTVSIENEDDYYHLYVNL